MLFGTSYASVLRQLTPGLTRLTPMPFVIITALPCVLGLVWVARTFIIQQNLRIIQQNLDNPKGMSQNMVCKTICTMLKSSGCPWQNVLLLAFAKTRVRGKVLRGAAPSLTPHILMPTLKSYAILRTMGLSYASLTPGMFSIPKVNTLRRMLFDRISFDKT